MFAVWSSMDPVPSRGSRTFSTTASPTLLAEGRIRFLHSLYVILFIVRAEGSGKIT